MFKQLLMAALWSAAGLIGQDTPISGHYLEDRSSRVYGCPCEFSGEYASAGREAVLAWKIESGEYQGQGLAGLRLAAVLAGNFTLSDPTSRRRSALFVDAGSPAEQRRAGLAWLQARYGDALGQVLGIHVLSIDLQIDAEGAALRIGDFLDLRMRRAKVEEDTPSWAFLLYDPLTKLTSATLGTTLRSQYSGPDLQMRWTRDEAAVTGYYGTFSLK
ncbi:MAG TPA: DUF1326 domain-containing protein [Bryobacteraceae bacterium]|nr:DUF1326 domain-containing protein [Bryobacteraceae bacterium]